MVTEIHAPTILKSSMTASVGRWFKRVGDPVTLNEPLVEIDRDNVTQEVPAPITGVLSAIMVKDGGSVEQGGLLGTVTSD